MYPLAGGGQVWVMRGLGDIFGFTAGWSVLLAFTVDIALFAYIAIGYFNRLLPSQVNHLPWILLEPIVLVSLLWVLNVFGVRESSKLNEIAGAIDIVAESALIFIGFILAFAPHYYVGQIGGFWHHPNINQLLLGTSLAIISFVGLESISQAAQETQRPTTVIPRTSVALIMTILAYALALSNLSLGMVSWQSFDPGSPHCHPVTVACAAIHHAHQAHENAPMVWLAAHLPYLGPFMGPVIAVLGASLLLISSNSGVYGSSRIVYAMAKNDVMPKFFTRVHPKYNTPVLALGVFCGIAILELIASAFTPNTLQTLAEMYAFSAAVNYLLVFVALLRLRFIDPDTPRSFRVPWNVPVRRRGQAYYVPIVGVLGLLSLVAVLIMVILTNEIGRTLGPAWVLLGLAFYFIYRRRRKLPVLGSVPRNWASEQIEAYEDSGETELADEYREALRRRDRTNRLV